MLSLQELQHKLQSEGLVPLDAGNSGGLVAFNQRGCIYWGCIYPKDCCRIHFTDDDFYHLYLQIEMGKNLSRVFCVLAFSSTRQSQTKITRGGLQSGVASLTKIIIGRISRQFRRHSTRLSDLTKNGATDIADCPVDFLFLLVLRGIDYVVFAKASRGRLGSLRRWKYRWFRRFRRVLLYLLREPAPGGNWQNVLYRRGLLLHLPSNRERHGGRAPLPTSCGQDEHKRRRGRSPL